MSTREQMGRRRWPWLLMGLLACGDLVDDPSFDQWCGGELCRWETRQGEIARVKTWHKRDHGVGLLGSPVELAQVTDYADIDCLRFSVVANVEARARVSMVLDFNNDGVEDFEQQIPASRWDETEFLVHAPAAYHGVTFLIRKAGEGRAEVAQLRATRQAAEECPGARIVLSDLPAGAGCGADGECADSRCTPLFEQTERGYCGGCAVDDECAMGEACAWDRDDEAAAAADTDAGEPRRPVRRYRSCVARDALATGLPTAEACVHDDECGSGACVPNLLWVTNDRFCAECGSDADCPDGTACLGFGLREAADDVGPVYLGIGACLVPGSEGAMCTTDADCDVDCCPFNADFGLCAGPQGCGDP